MMRSFLLLSAVLVAAFLGPADAQTRVPQAQSEIALGFAPLVKQAAPAVVNIYARRVVETRQSPFMNDPFFRDFFRDFGETRPRVQNSLGSGVILSPDGLIVSNFHVVGLATDIRVVLSDRREFSARVVLGDEESDLAILQIEGASGLPYLTLRDSDLVEVGELVLAVGNPFGVGQTVSSGIVSGLARSGAITGQARGYFLQTDAPINPGNSGGALIDVNGDLIGINTSILSRSGGSNGIGFAIPANLVAQFVQQARAGNDAFLRPWAGMAGQPVDADMAAVLGLDVPEGIVISDLHPASPFSRAGFLVGDVISHVDGLPVNSPSEMLFRMSVSGIGSSTRITRVHDTQRSEIDVPLIVAPDEPAAEERQLGTGSALPGLTIARANPALIARLGLPLTTEGVVVTDPGPVALRAGLRPGDVIARINNAPIARSGDVVASLRDSGRWVAIDLLRRGQPVQVRFRL